MFNKKEKFNQYLKNETFVTETRSGEFCGSPCITSFQNSVNMASKEALLKAQSPSPQKGKT